MKKINNNIFPFLLALVIVFSPVYWAKAIEVQPDKDEIGSYGIQEVVFNISSDQNRKIEITSQLVNNKKEILNKSTTNKYVGAGESFDFVTYMQVIDGAYGVNLEIKDAITGDVLEKSNIVKVEDAQETVVGIVNPVIDLILYEDFLISSYKLDLMLTNGEVVQANLKSLANDKVPTDKLGKVEIPVNYNTADNKYIGETTLVFNVKEGKLVKEILSETISARINEEVNLPNQVEVIFQDGTSQMKNVSWESQPDMSIAGEQVIKGRVPGTILQAELRVLVEDYGLEDVYVFENKYVKDYVRGLIGPNPTYGDLLKITDISINFYDDGNFSDLRYMKNIEKLDLSFNFAQNTDFSALSELENLKTLKLFSGGVSSINFLKDLTNLESLDLNTNSVKDISPLASLKNLNSLNLSGNNSLTDIKALRWTNQLVDLQLPNSVKDFTPIVEYNNKLKEPFSIVLLEGSGGKIRHKVKADEDYYLPYAIIMDGQIRYVDWDVKSLGIQDNQYIDGYSDGDVFTLELIRSLRDDSEVIEIPDAIFEEEVRKAIDKGFGDITYGDIKNLKFIDLSGKGVKDFTGLENFVGLENLKLWANPTFNNDDLERIKGMKNLKFIDLGSTGITRINSDSFRGLDKLIEIAIDGVKLYEIPENAFETNTNLLWLHVNSTGITNLNFLQGLENLESLYAEENRISDISGLRHTPNLTTLMLSYNNISDTNSIGSLSKLESLRIDHNKVESIDLSGLVNLDNLWINHNSISDISTLEDSMNLEIVHMDNNNISNIEVLRDKINLRQIQMRNNKVEDLSPLSGLTNLKVLWIKGNPVTDFTPVEPIYNNLTNKDFEM